MNPGRFELPIFLFFAAFSHPPCPRAVYHRTASLWPLGRITSNAMLPVQVQTQQQKQQQQRPQSPWHHWLRSSSIAVTDSPPLSLLAPRNAFFTSLRHITWRVSWACVRSNLLATCTGGPNQLKSDIHTVPVPSPRLMDGFGNTKLTSGQIWPNSWDSVMSAFFFPLCVPSLFAPPP